MGLHFARTQRRKRSKVSMGWRCVVCRKVREDNEYGRYTTPAGLKYRRRTCNKCRVEKAKLRYANYPIVRKKALLAAEQARFRKLYRITLEDRDIILKKQGGKCKICRKKANLHVDHCHKTNVVRGLLCGSCNRGLGLFHESKKSLENAIKYLS